MKIFKIGDIVVDEYYVEGLDRIGTIFSVDDELQFCGIDWKDLVWRRIFFYYQF